MKTLAFSFIAVIATCSSCLADSITVALGTTASSCTFSASSFSDGFSRAVTIGSASGGAGTGRPVISPATITKNVDKCTIPLLQELFKGNVLQTVVITIGGASTAAPLMTITLTSVFVTSISDADASSTAVVGPSEKVTLVFETIKITDPSGTLTCSALSDVCS